MPTTRVVVLPEELLDCIVKLVRVKADLLSLSYVCRLFHRLCVGLVYRNVTLSPHSLPRLIWTLHKNPHLAPFASTASAYIESDDEPAEEAWQPSWVNAGVDGFTWYIDSDDCDEDSDVNSELEPLSLTSTAPDAQVFRISDEELNDTVLRTAEAVGDDMTRLVQKMDQGRSTALLILVLHLLPKLSHLSLYLPRDGDALWNVIAGSTCQAAYLPAGLRTLTRLELKWCHGPPGLPVSRILPCFFLPSLTSLELCPLDDRDWDDAGELASLFISHCRSSSVEALTLHEGPIISSILSHLSLLPRRLLDLTLIVNAADGIMWEAAPLADILRPFQASLVRLELLFPPRLPLLVTELRLDSLVSFTRLTHLGISEFSCLIGLARGEQPLERMLPPLLCSLKVGAGHGWSTYAGERQLVESILHRPSIKKIAMCTGGDRWFPDDLGITCREQGVDLHMLASWWHEMVEGNAIVLLRPRRKF